MVDVVAISYLLQIMLDQVISNIYNMYNPFTYAVACKQYKRNDKEAFYTNSFTSSRTLAELQKSRSGILINQGSRSSRYYLNQQKFSQYQPDNTAPKPIYNSNVDNPFIKAMPIRYVEKDGFKNAKIGLTNWEKRKYLDTFMNGLEERVENEQNVDQHYLIQSDRPASGQSMRIIRAKPLFSKRQDVDVRQSITRPINIPKMYWQSEYDQQGQFKFEGSFEKVSKLMDQQEEQPLMSKLDDISQQKSNINKNKYSIGRNQSYGQITHKLYRLSNHIVQEEQEETISNSLPRKEKVQFNLNYCSQKQRTINFVKQHPKIINYRGQLFELIKMK